MIPKKVLFLLEKNEWNHIPKYTEATAERRPNGMYFVRPNDGGVSSGFTWREVLSLAKAGAFGQGALVRESDGVIELNELASHSLEEFLGACSTAWNEHRARLAKYVGGREDDEALPHWRW